MADPGALRVGFGGDGGAPLPREELFAGWRLFFERLAAVQPVVLVAEDAQHADAGLLDFLDSLTDWVRGLPVFILVLARPELGLARPGFGAGRNRVTLTLDPLDAASMNALVESLVPGMPAAARSAVTRQAQGLSLFAVETVRSLIDRDVVQPVDGVYRLTGDIGTCRCRTACTRFWRPGWMPWTRRCGGWCRMRRCSAARSRRKR